MEHVTARYSAQEARPPVSSLMYASVSGKPCSCKNAAARSRSCGENLRQKPHPPRMAAGVGMTRTENPLPASNCSAKIALETFSKQTTASLIVSGIPCLVAAKVAEACENRTHQGRFHPLTDLKSAAATRRLSPPKTVSIPPLFFIYNPTFKRKPPLYPSL